MLGPSAPAADVTVGSGYGEMLVGSLLVLGLVCLAAWVIVRVGTRRLWGPRRGGVLDVVARVPLEPRRSLYVVEASYIGKLGFDRQVRPNARVRLTGSMYRTKDSASNTLYGGDRAGSRYYYVLENTAATESAQATSGLINPGFRNKVTALQFNLTHAAQLEEMKAWGWKI